MANCVTTVKAREKMVKARAGDLVLPKITHMAFGKGGVDSGGIPIAPSESDVSLKTELLRKLVDGHTYPASTTCRYTCTLTKAELANENINEIALIDETGDIVAIKTFTNKGKDPDMEMIFEIDDEF